MNRTSAKYNLTDRIMAALMSAAFVLLLAAAAVAFSARPVFAARGYQKVAGSSDMYEAKEIGKYGMIPVYGRDIKDGEYTIEGESNSYYFKIDSAKLRVRNGRLQVTFTIPSESYKCVYMGTPEQAAKADKSEYVMGRARDGITHFTVPLKSLDTKFECAAFSSNKKMWYGRKIIFYASSLPSEALKIKLPDYDKIDKAVKYYDEHQDGDDQSQSGSSSTDGHSNSQGSSAAPNTGTVISNKPLRTKRKDGTYSIEVNMTGGSGRASVSSPTWLIVKNGRVYARLLWSSTHYDYMKIGQKKYNNETKDGGNSTFTIPVAAMDKPLTVIADTTAMGSPKEIEYQVTFYKNTIGDVSRIPQEAAKRVIKIAVVIIILGAVLNFILKRRRKQ